jgi:hypothetical protein
MFLNTVAIDAVRTAPIQRWWYKAIAIIDPAHITSDPPHAYMSVVNESSRRLFSSLTVDRRLLQQFLAIVQQFYTTGKHPSTQYTDVKQSHPQRSGNGNQAVGQRQFSMPHKSL